MKRLDYQNHCSSPEYGGYLEKCSFLPMLTNELPRQRNSTRKQQFSRLRNLFENNTVLVPKETSWSGFCPDGALRPVLPPQQVFVSIFEKKNKQTNKLFITCLNYHPHR
ncbi:unnamed protein product [Camellia sinensis]